MRATRFIGLAAASLVLAAGLVAPGTASAQVDRCRAEGATVVPVSTPDGRTLYIDYRGDDEVWLYEETNGVEGLQRGGSTEGAIPLLTYEDYCQLSDNPDKVLY